jgi:hypothetical protein
VIPLTHNGTRTKSRAALDALDAGRSWFTHPTRPGRLLPACLGSFGGSVPPFDTHCWHGDPLAQACGDCAEDTAHLEAA